MYTLCTHVSRKSWITSTVAKTRWQERGKKEYNEQNGVKNVENIKTSRRKTEQNSTSAPTETTLFFLFFSSSFCCCCFWILFYNVERIFLVWKCIRFFPFFYSPSLAFFSCSCEMSLYFLFYSYILYDMCCCTEQHFMNTDELTNSWPVYYYRHRSVRTHMWCVSVSVHSWCTHIVLVWWGGIWYVWYLLLFLMFLLLLLNVMCWSWHQRCNMVLFLLLPQIRMSR